MGERKLVELQEECKALKLMIEVIKSKDLNSEAHEHLSNTIQGMTLRMATLMDELEDSRAEYERLKRVNQELSKQVTTFKQAVLDGKTSVITSKILAEAREYLNEVLFAYKSLESLAKTQLLELEEKKERLLMHGELVKRLRDQTKKDQQLKAIGEAVQFAPVLGTLPLKGENLKHFTLLAQGIHKLKSAKLEKYKEVAEKYNSLLQVVQEKYPPFEEKLLEYEAINES
eukprot:TRINITY_DN7587_c0_g1_i10.p2 TRINITY_DN7587_c0_g1~~TRINITY_DN7587_c0_g1_i10.p2  ORF type:complete len:229 (-),score=109.70 TRINITY_DN7587_c0_g1_i10:137-823(-)